MQIQRNADYDSIVAESNYCLQSEDDPNILCAFHDKLNAYILTSKDPEKKNEIEGLNFRIIRLLAAEDKTLSLKIQQSLEKVLQSKKEPKMRQNAFQELRTIKEAIQNPDKQPKFPHTLAVVKNIAGEIEYNYIKQKRTDFLERDYDLIRQTENHFLQDVEDPVALCAFHDKLNAYVLTLKKSEERNELENLKSKISLRLDSKDKNLSLKIEESLKKVIASRKDLNGRQSSTEELSRIKKELQDFENAWNKFPDARGLINNITNEFDSEIIRSLDVSNLNANGELRQDCGMSAGSLTSLNEKLRTFGSASSAGFERTALSSDCLSLFLNSINREEISEKIPELPFAIWIYKDQIQHWVLFTIDPVQKTVSEHDSLGTKSVPDYYKPLVKKQAQQRIAEPIQSMRGQGNQKKHEIDFTNYKWENKSYQVQFDNNSCGVWVILTAYKVLESPDFSWESKKFTKQQLAEISAAFRMRLHITIFKAACDDFINAMENKNCHLKLGGSLPKEEIKNMFADFCREWNI